MDSYKLKDKLKELREIKDSVESAQKAIDVLSDLCLLPDNDKYWNIYQEFLKGSAEEASLIHFDPRKHYSDYIIRGISKRIKSIESKIINKTK